MKILALSLTGRVTWAGVSTSLILCLRNGGGSDSRVAARMRKVHAEPCLEQQGPPSLQLLRENRGQGGCGDTVCE